MPDRAVVFDLYGTLVDELPRSSWAEMAHALADHLELDREPFADLWEETYHLRATGPFEASMRTIYERLGAEWDAARYETLGTLRRTFVERGLALREDAEETVAELKRRGYTVGLMTECGDAVPVLWPTMPIARHFDAAVYSCEVGERKPAPVLYELMCERLGVEPRDCVYVGDGGGYELAGAAKTGMRPILISVPSSPWLHPEAEAWRGERVAALSDLLDLL